MKLRKPLHINPQISYIFIMLVQLLLLININIPVHDPMVFLLFVLTAFSLILRLRVKLKPTYMVIDMTIVLMVSIFNPNAFVFLIIFAYYYAYNNKYIYLLPLIIIGLILNDNIYYLLLIQAVLFGAILCQWSKDSIGDKEQLDSLRKRIYELELIQAQLLMDYKDTERISRLTERQRIAEILHDTLGHELTAAHLQVKAYKTLIDNNRHEQAQKTLIKIENKIEYSLTQLKDSVKYIEPLSETGLNDLTYLINNYLYPINFTHSGPIIILKPYLWQLITMSTKEALTNITKHAQPKFIRISLDVTDYIVRLIIENDGIKVSKELVLGHGLRYMRNRLEAINGSLSVQKQEIFKLIITIPIENSR
jgi:signal transduction histidine kinase